MLLSEATKYIETFLTNPLGAPQEELEKAVKVWAEVTKDYVSRITLETPARLNMNFDRLLDMEMKISGIVFMIDNADSPVGGALKEHLKEDTFEALVDLNVSITEMQQHIKNQVDLAWKNL